MSGCDRCGHRRRDHYPLIGKPGVYMCVMVNGNRACLCPKYLKPGTMTLSTPRTETSE